MPESFRWLVSHNKLEKAEEVISTMARLNRKPTPDLTKLFQIMVEKENVRDQQYTIIDMVRSRDLLKKTLVIIFTW